MRQYKVKGLYRCDIDHEHGTSITKPYEVSFEGSDHLSRGDVIKYAGQLVLQQDKTFDSLKTHEIFVTAAETPKNKPVPPMPPVPPVVEENIDDIFGDAATES